MEKLFNYPAQRSVLTSDNLDCEDRTNRSHRVSDERDLCQTCVSIVSILLQHKTQLAIFR